MGLWGTFMEAIPAYTGLSPVTFFTLLAVLVGVYHLVSGMFGAPETHARDFVPMEPLPQPVQLGEVTEEELKAYDGTDPKKPLLMAIKGQIYDVSQSRSIADPCDAGFGYSFQSNFRFGVMNGYISSRSGPYALFAGKDASRALAKMSFEDKDLTGDLEGLGAFELDALQDWEYKFMGKYVKVGQIKKSEVKEVEVTGGTSDNGPEAGHGTREVQTSEENVPEAVNITREVVEGTTDNASEAANGTLDAEVATEPKENGAEPKDDNSVTKDPVEISEASEESLDGKKIKEIVHEVNHAVAVA
ncbi:hypothetical protein KI387_038437 [Taxus chinensis]|uniref:Cytochrome b5 heme-binding domain-containing protein n=1 Tax=Taxus chinensis TaxID=29808 RepID=A0AA38F726_TAXCH|nr:hypothetical protein KI387_038437 [Taxus chinensis]